jgi:hypothetical protein
MEHSGDAKGVVVHAACERSVDRFSRLERPGMWRWMSRQSRVPMMPWAV